MTFRNSGDLRARIRSGPAALAREAERLQGLRGELSELRQAAERTTVPDVREVLLFTVDQCSQALDVIDACRGGNTTLPPVVIGLAERAIARAWAVESGRALGVHPLSILWAVAAEFGSACAYATDTLARRENASPKHSASRTLRSLATQYPEKTAAELRRMVEKASGGRMDESAARAVVRKARAANKR